MAQTFIGVIPGYEEFPKWKFKGVDSCLVCSAAEESELKGWGDVPGFEADEFDDDGGIPVLAKPRRGRPPKVVDNA